MIKTHKLYQEIILHTFEGRKNKKRFFQVDNVLFCQLGLIHRLLLCPLIVPWEQWTEKFKPVPNSGIDGVIGIQTCDWSVLTKHPLSLVNSNQMRFIFYLANTCTKFQITLLSPSLRSLQHSNQIILKTRISTVTINTWDLATIFWQIFWE